MTHLDIKRDLLPLKDHLFRLALRIVTDRPEAEDIVQDVLVKIWEMRDTPTFREIQHLETYALTMTRNMALDHLEQQRLRYIPLYGRTQEGDEGYEAEQEQLKAAAKQQAEELLEQWKSGGATEDFFAQLANENSSDSGSNTNGGLYEQVAPGDMVAEFNDWCFDASRKAGDTGIVETSYGYHVMYFVGTDLPCWQVEVRKALTQQDYNTWYEEKTAGYTAEQSSFGVQFVG